MSKISAQFKSRPHVTLHHSEADFVAEALGICGLLFGVWALWRYWPSLPNAVPQHFDFGGKPDRWGSKKGLLFLPMLSTIIYVGFTVLSRYPRWFNYLWKITPENARRQYALARSLIIWVKAGIAWIFSIILWNTIQVALGKAASLGPLFLPAVILLIYGPIVVYLVKSYRAR